VDCIDGAQIVYNNIIEAEKSERGPFTNSDIAKINDRFMHAFYYGLRYSDISRKAKWSFTHRNVWDGRKGESRVDHRGEIWITVSIYFFTQISALRVRYPPKPPSANGEIKDTITAGKFRANSLTTLAIQIVGTVGTLVGRSAPIGVSQLHTMPLDFRIWFRIINNTLSVKFHLLFYFIIRNAVSKTKTQSLASACFNKDSRY